MGASGARSARADERAGGVPGLDLSIAPALRALLALGLGAGFVALVRVGDDASALNGGGPRRRIQVRRTAAFEDTFPLPMKRIEEVRRLLPRYLFQRLRKKQEREALVRESVRSLDAIAGASAKPGVIPAAPPEGRATLVQADMFRRVGRRTLAAGAMPGGGEKEALLELLRTKDIHD